MGTSKWLWARLLIGPMMALGFVAVDRGWPILIISGLLVGNSLFWLSIWLTRRTTNGRGSAPDHDNGRVPK